MKKGLANRKKAKRADYFAAKRRISPRPKQMHYLCLRNSTPQRPMGKAAKFCDSTLAQVQHNLSAKKFLKTPPDRRRECGGKKKKSNP